MLGGFKVRVPLVVAAMGSTDVANKRGLILSEGCFGPANKLVKKLDNQADGIVNFVEAIKVEA